MPRNETAATPGADSGDRGLVARGAGIAFVGRMGALIDPIAFIVFARLYGEATLGLFFLLWGYVLLVAMVADFGMTAALQRFVPLQTTADGANRALRNAFLVSIPASLVVVAGLYAAAPLAAEFINTDGLSVETVTRMIRIYAWAVPLWTFIDVATASVRARRVFGPEILVRGICELGLRLIAGIAFFLAGWKTFGLFAAHLTSLGLTAIVSILLVGRYYSLGALFGRRRPEGGPTAAEMAKFGVHMILPNMSKKLHSTLPQFFLNAVIPGAAGAASVAIYAGARKIVSMIQVIRESFEYVLAPIASAMKREAALDRMGDIYAFSTRFICASFIPAAAIIIVFRDDLLALPGPEFLAGSAALVVLVLGRMVEAATGPSSAIIAMIGKYRLPLLNALGGVLATIMLLALLVPELGVTGGAIAAAVGLNVTSIAALAEVHFIHGLRAFDRRLVRPLVTSVLASGALVLLVTGVAGAGVMTKAAMAAAGLAAVLLTVLRYGFSDDDLAILLPNSRLRVLSRLARRSPTQR